MLKLNVLAFILSTFMIVSCGKVPCQEDIYGVWNGEHNGKELLFEFKSDQTCVISFRDEKAQSVEVIDGDFELDLTKRPIPLSIRNIPQLNHPLHTIIQFMGNDSVKIANFAPRWRLRPISFDGNTSMKLKRAKENK